MKNKKIKFKGKHSFLGVQIFLIFFLTLGVTFSLKYIYDSINASLTTATINAHYVGANMILGNDLSPILIDDIGNKAIRANFTVKGTLDNPDVLIYYDVVLRNISITEGLIHKDFKWQLVKNDVVISSGDFSGIKEDEGETSYGQYQRVILTSDVMELPKYSTSGDRIELRVYILSTELDQSAMMGQSFSADVGVDLYTSDSIDVSREKYTNLIQVDKRVNKKLDNVRYVKDCISGNNIDDNNYWGEIKVLVNDINVASSADLVFSNSYNNSNFPIGNLIDDNINTLVDGGIGDQCVVLDLKRNYDIDSISVWHDYNEEKTYNDNITYVSSNGANWLEVINRVESESYTGKTVDVSFN